MDHSWRPPSLPQIQGHNNICPNCSTAHFPFCPPPPFIQNPRFNYPQSQIDYYHQRPRFDHHHPFPNHQSSLSYNHGFNPINGHVGIRPTWYGSNPSDPLTANGNYSNYHTGGVISASYGHDGYDNGGIKRMKIEPGMGGEIADTARSSSDNERILKLIHDHGNAANASPGDLTKVRPNLTSESDGETGNRYAHGRFEETRDVSDEMGFKRKLHQREAAPFHSGFQRSELNQKLLPSSFGTSFHGRPPLPVSPPPPLPIEPPRNHFFEPFTSPPVQKPSLFPIGSRSSADSSPSLRSAIPEHQSSAQVYYANNATHHASNLSTSEEFYISSEKPNIIDAARIFKQPHRGSRPDHFVIILRGLPGSGKSYMAKVLRDIEVENGGEAPRIHSMDEYFMTEVEKAEDSELSKSAGSFRGRRQVMKTVMEYCYEPEMEEAYRASMLKAFKKTLDEGVYSFIIVDDRNLRVADFAQFWATAKRSGYEVYLVEASYKDPAGCAARNVHNFTQDDIQKMAGQWEEAPSLYLKMDVKSLLHGDGSGESGIQEVDMDMEDDDDHDPSHGSDITHIKKDEVDDFTPQDVGTTSNPDDVNKNHNNHTPEVKHLSKSKWSNDLDENESSFEGEKLNNGALSGLIQTYSSKEGKSVRWGDQGGNVGFSISATRKATTRRSLVIGPGSGYNLKSNPLSEEEYLKPGPNPIQPKSQNVFQQQIRAECESFKAVFDKRKQRIGGFNVDDE